MEESFWVFDDELDLCKLMVSLWIRGDYEPAIILCTCAELHTPIIIPLTGLVYLFGIVRLYAVVLDPPVETDWARSPRLVE